MFSNTPMGDDPPSKVIAYFGDSGHRHRIEIAWVVAGLGFLFFLFFVAALREAVARLEGDGVLATLAAIGGAIYAALGLAAFSLEAGVRTMSDDTFHHQVFPEVIHAADDASWMIHAAGGAGLAVMIVAVSIAFIRSAAMPSWLGGPVWSAHSPRWRRSSSSRSSSGSCGSFSSRCCSSFEALPGPARRPRRRRNGSEGSRLRSASP